MIDEQSLKKLAADLVGKLQDTEEYKQLIAVRKQLHILDSSSYDENGNVISGQDKLNLSYLVNQLPVSFKTEKDTYVLEYPHLSFERLQKLIEYNAKSRLKIDLIDLPQFINDKFSPFFNLKINEVTQEHLFNQQLTFVNLITELQENENAIDLSYKICALFLNTANEDRRTFDHSLEAGKIQDWKDSARIEDGFLSANFFLSLAIILLKWFNQNL